MCYLFSITYTVPFMHTLSLRRVPTPCPHTVFPHRVTTSCPHTLSPHRVPTLCSHTVSPHFVPTPCIHTFSPHHVTAQGHPMSINLWPNSVILLMPMRWHCLNYLLREIESWTQTRIQWRDMTRSNSAHTSLTSSSSIPQSAIKNPQSI